MKKDIITICVCAYKRRNLLKLCLSSLNSIEIPDNTIVKLVVVDNDPAQSAKNIFNEHITNLNFLSYYFCEEKRGITYARARCLRESRALSTDFLVFIDSDEVVTRTWLVNLYKAYIALNEVCVLSGGIRTIKARTSKEITSILSNGHTNNNISANKIDICGTGNSFIPLSVIGNNKTTFDYQHPFLTGEDSHFFYKLANNGSNFYQLTNPQAFEIVPPLRQHLRYKIKRTFSVGMALRHYKLLRKGSQLNFFSHSLFNFLAQLTRLVVCIPFLYSDYGKKTFFKLVGKTGTLYASLGGTYQFYKCQESTSDLEC